jgi:hypothetical protein
MRDDDDNWFDALAGHEESADGAPSAAEGAALREAVLARRTADPGAIDALDPRREAQLVSRARAAGLLQPSAESEQPRVARTNRRLLLPLSLAAVLGCLAIGLSLQMRTATRTEVVRGNASGPVRISAEDPLRLKRELIAELEAAGIHATGYENLGRQGLDADLPTPLPGAVREILVRHGIPLPTTGLLVLEIEPTPAK